MGGPVSCLSLGPPEGRGPGLRVGGGLPSCTRPCGAPLGPGLAPGKACVSGHLVLTPAWPRGVTTASPPRQPLVFGAMVHRDEAFETIFSQYLKITAAAASGSDS